MIEIPLPLVSHRRLFSPLAYRQSGRALLKGAMRSPYQRQRQAKTDSCSGHRPAIQSPNPAQDRSIKYSAEYPQLHRLMAMEGRKESVRLVWLIERHVSRFFAISTKLIREAQALGVVRPGDPGQLHYCAIGAATAAFSLAPEYKLVTGKDPFTRSHVEQIADLVCDFLFVRPGNGASEAN